MKHNELIKAMIGQHGESVDPSYWELTDSVLTAREPA